MTGSTSRCWASRPDPARAPALARLIVVFLALLLLPPPPAHASGIEVLSTSMVPGEEYYLLSVEAQVQLNGTLEDVVERGVPLYFVAELEISRPRWYWFDEVVAARSLSYRLSYHALTRQYRLSSGPLHQNFQSLADALHVLSRIREWPAVERRLLGAGATYEAAFRLRLDLAQLPKPIQVSAIGSREWNLSSDWVRWGLIGEGR